MTTTSADPDDLTTYVAAAGDGTSRLTSAAGDLRGALDAFRASEGRAAFIADVPEVDLDLSFLARRWDRLAIWLDGVAAAFTAADAGDGGPLSLPDEVLARRAGRYQAPEVEVIRREGRLLLDTGIGRDVVVLSEGDGVVVVAVNGTVYRFVATADDQVVLRLGAGDDVVTPTPGSGATRAGLVLDGGSGADVLSVAVAVAGGGAVVRGGSGDDRLRGGDGVDRLLGGSGDDRIVGGGGDDRLLGGDGSDVIDGDAGDDWASAGAGDDLVYGGRGDDLVHGGAGRDHLDTGAGADHVGGGTGDDIVSGGEGHDTIGGGAGADVVYAGPGRDLVAGDSGVDRVHVEGDDVVVGDGHDAVLDHAVDLALVDTIVIDPPEGAFADRVRADLVTLASTQSGAALLETLRGHTITVVADLGYDGLATDAYDRRDDRVQYAPDDDAAGFGAFALGSLRTGPSYSPLVALHHELVHASHDVNGRPRTGGYRGPDREQRDTNQDGEITYDDDDDVDEDGDGFPDHDVVVDNEERATVGLPIDHDQNPNTPDVPADELYDGFDITENDLRRELGLPERERY